MNHFPPDKTEWQPSPFALSYFVTSDAPSPFFVRGASGGINQKNLGVIDACHVYAHYIGNRYARAGIDPHRL